MGGEESEEIEESQSPRHSSAACWRHQNTSWDWYQRHMKMDPDAHRSRTRACLALGYLQARVGHYAFAMIANGEIALPGYMG